MIRYTYEYRKGTTRVFIGKYEDLITELAQTGEYLKYRKNGKLYVGYEPYGCIIEVDSEKFGQPCRKIDAHPYIRNILHKRHVTEADYKRLTEALNNGKLHFDELYLLYGFVD